ncbi:hypothetical protein AXE65_04445 [Ventosimonas gracilis]|uniref:Lipoprotein n=1 Tax=Ventosimonas gracilis TaxID=1680762 RepID=A0A139SQP1_9GAMM|nr:GNA1162 family protein [Ventosimonas gracilis]KXU36896.1 hypothetical protein AXE65_04445 [Ventosimonas gracilis]
MKGLLSCAKTTLLLCFIALLSACANAPIPPDHSALINHRPDSLLVLPPLNSTVEENAVPAILASSTAPLSEMGYYVIPVTNMMETFAQNGLLTAADIHAVPPAKLREIFGADAALYMEVDKYGTRYIVIDSVTEISVAAKLVDLRSGAGTLWKNRVDLAVSTGGSNQGLLGALVSAVVNQIANTVRDNGYPLSKQAMSVLFQTSRNALIPGQKLEDRRE